MSILPANSAAAKSSTAGKSLRHLAWSLALFVTLLLVVAGCQTESPDFPIPTSVEQLAMTATNHTETIVLREGDTLRITFPGAQNLNTVCKILRDGNITLAIVGEIKAAGKTPLALREDLLKAYKDQIESKEITVEVVSSEFPIFVSGAVLRPMKVMSDHPMTVLEAIMECGGFDYTKADLKHVHLYRQEGKRLKMFTVNLKEVLNGHKLDQQFYVQPFDIIYIPEKFSWF